MLLALDVHYESGAATTALVGFSGWFDAEPALEDVIRTAGAPAPYEPGAFYRRELPYLLAAVQEAERRVAIEAVIVDAHVWLGEGRPGLGARLHQALGQRLPVVGVAKSAFAGGSALPVLRGKSLRPLHVSAAGMDPGVAAEHVRSMHGPDRLPALLVRADQLARGLRPVDPAKQL